MLRITNSSGWECFSVNNSPKDSGGYSSAAFGIAAAAVSHSRLYSHVVKIFANV